MTSSLRAPSPTPAVPAIPAIPAWKRSRRCTAACCKLQSGSSGSRSFWAGAFCWCEGDPHGPQPGLAGAGGRLERAGLAGLHRDSADGIAAEHNDALRRDSALTRLFFPVRTDADRAGTGQRQRCPAYGFLRRFGRTVRRDGGNSGGGLLTPIPSGIFCRNVRKIHFGGDGENCPTIQKQIGG